MVLFVAGIFDFGNQGQNSGAVVVALRTAQSLLGLPGGVTRLWVKVAAPFDAETMAQQIAAQPGIHVESWIETNAEFFKALSGQTLSFFMIRLFVGLTAALGIASVLVVSVVQKSKEIGILRATGTTRRQILGVFLLQGAILGLLGSVLGSLMGWGFLVAWRGFAVNDEGGAVLHARSRAAVVPGGRAGRHGGGRVVGAVPGAACGAAGPGGGDPWLKLEAVADVPAQTTVEPTLRLEGIHKSYGTGTQHETEVLHGIDLNLARGEFAALIGPSGSGKSTLLNIIGLLDKPSSGKIYLTGQEAETLADKALTQLRARAVGFVFQFHNLLPAFTAVENVMLPLLAARGRPDAAMRKRAEALIDQVGLKAWGHHLANDLSGGQQQRVAIARALVMQPALVLADEPTGNLDTQSANSVFDLLRDVSSGGTTFLIVTHDPRLAARCDRLIELVDGRVQSDKATLATRPGDDGKEAGPT